MTCISILSSTVAIHDSISDRIPIPEASLAQDVVVKDFEQHFSADPSERVSLETRNSLGYKLN